jgi:pyruvate/2-oxoacid:ferredoxin oxidoreductase beta subunit
MDRSIEMLKKGYIPIFQYNKSLENTDYYAKKYEILKKEKEKVEKELSLYKCFFDLKDQLEILKKQQASVEGKITHTLKLIKEFRYKN